jgi:hypothetical protein
MLPVRGACEEVGWRGSSRSSRFAGMGVSLSLNYGRGRIVREGWWWEGVVPSSGSMRSSSSTCGLL